MPQIFLGTRFLMSCRSSTLHPSNARHVFCDACTGHSAPFFKPQAWSGCAWVSTIALGCSRSNFPSQSRPQSIITLASRYDTSRELCMRCRRVRASISPRVPRNVSLIRASCDQFARSKSNAWAHPEGRGRGRWRVHLAFKFLKRNRPRVSLRFFSQTRAFFMRRGNSQSRPPRDGLAVASVLLIMLLVCSGKFSTTAQEPVRTPQGTIATCAPVVENVGPTLLTALPTQGRARAVSPSLGADAPFGDVVGGHLPPRRGRLARGGGGCGVRVSADA